MVGGIIVQWHGAITLAFFGGVPYLQHYCKWQYYDHTGLEALP